MIVPVLMLGACGKGPERPVLAQATFQSIAARCHAQDVRFSAASADAASGRKYQAEVAEIAFNRPSSVANPASTSASRRAGPDPLWSSASCSLRSRSAARLRPAPSSRPPRAAVEGWNQPTRRGNRHR